MSRAASPEESYERILRERAKALAAAPAAGAERRVVARVALVRAGGGSIGIPVEGLREIVPRPAVAPLPRLPAWMPGIAQIRGELLGVVDLADWLGTESGSAREFLAVIEAEQGSLGLLVEEVLGFREIGADELAETFDAPGKTDRPFRGTTRDLVVILDLARLLTDGRLQV